MARRTAAPIPPQVFQVLRERVLAVNAAAPVGQRITLAHARDAYRRASTILASAKPGATRLDWALSFLPSPQALVARGTIIDSLGRRFNPLLHPRGRDGKFVEKGGFVRLYSNTGDRQGWAVGEVTGINPDGSVNVKVTGAPGHPDQVGKEQRVGAKNLSQAKRVAQLGNAVVRKKATLNPVEAVRQRRAERHGGEALPGDRPQIVSVHARQRHIAERPGERTGPDRNGNPMVVGARVKIRAWGKRAEKEGVVVRYNSNRGDFVVRFPDETSESGYKDLPIVSNSLDLIEQDNPEANLREFNRQIPGQQARRIAQNQMRSHLQPIGERVAKNGLRRFEQVGFMGRDGKWQEGEIVAILPNLREIRVRPDQGGKVQRIKASNAQKIGDIREAAKGLGQVPEAAAVPDDTPYDAPNTPEEFADALRFAGIEHQGDYRGVLDHGDGVYQVQSGPGTTEISVLNPDGSALGSVNDPDDARRMIEEDLVAKRGGWRQQERPSDDEINSFIDSLPPDFPHHDAASAILEQVAQTPRGSENWVEEVARKRLKAAQNLISGNGVDARALNLRDRSDAPTDSSGNKVPDDFRPVPDTPGVWVNHDGYVARDGGSDSNGILLQSPQGEEMDVADDWDAVQRAIAADKASMGQQPAQAPARPLRADFPEIDEIIGKLPPQSNRMNDLPASEQDKIRARTALEQAARLDTANAHYNKHVSELLLTAEEMLGRAGAPEVHDVERIRVARGDKTGEDVGAIAQRGDRVPFTQPRQQNPRQADPNPLDRVEAEGNRVLPEPALPDDRRARRDPYQVAREAREAQKVAATRANDERAALLAQPVPQENDLGAAQEQLAALRDNLVIEQMAPNIGVDPAARNERGKAALALGQALRYLDQGDAPQANKRGVQALIPLKDPENEALRARIEALTKIGLPKIESALFPKTPLMGERKLLDAPTARAPGAPEAPELPGTLTRDQLDGPSSFIPIGEKDQQEFSGWKMHIRADNADEVWDAYQKIAQTMHDRGIGGKVATSGQLGRWDGTPQAGKGITLYLPDQGKVNEDARAIMQALGDNPNAADITNDLTVAPGVGMRYELKNVLDRNSTRDEYMDNYYPAALENPAQNDALHMLGDLLPGNDAAAPEGPQAADFDPGPPPDALIGRFVKLLRWAEGQQGGGGVGGQRMDQVVAALNRAGAAGGHGDDWNAAMGDAIRNLRDAAKPSQAEGLLKLAGDFKKWHDSAVPEAPAAPEVPEAPGSPEAPGAPAVPNVPQAPPAPAAPAEPIAPVRPAGLDPNLDEIEQITRNVETIVGQPGNDREAKAVQDFLDAPPGQMEDRLQGLADVIEGQSGAPGAPQEAKAALEALRARVHDIDAAEGGQEMLPSINAPRDPAADLRANIELEIRALQGEGSLPPGVSGALDRWGDATTDVERSQALEAAENAALRSGYDSALAVAQRIRGMRDPNFTLPSDEQSTALNQSLSEIYGNITDPGVRLHLGKMIVNGKPNSQEFNDSLASALDFADRAKNEPLHREIDNAVRVFHGLEPNRAPAFVMRGKRMDVQPNISPDEQRAVLEGLAGDIEAGGQGSDRAAFAAMQIRDALDTDGNNTAERNSNLQAAELALLKDDNIEQARLLRAARSSVDQWPGGQDNSPEQNAALDDLQSVVDQLRAAHDALPVTTTTGSKRQELRDAIGAAQEMMITRDARMANYGEANRRLRAAMEANSIDTEVLDRVPPVQTSSGEFGDIADRLSGVAMVGSPDNFNINPSGEVDPELTFEDVDSGSAAMKVRVSGPDGKQYILKREVEDQGTNAEVDVALFYRELGFEAPAASRVNPDATNPEQADVFLMDLAGRENNLSGVADLQNLGMIYPSLQDLNLADEGSVLRLVASNGVIRNTDRNPGNAMYGTDADGKGHILPIDHGRSMFNTGRAENLAYNGVDADHWANDSHTPLDAVLAANGVQGNNNQFLHAAQDYINKVGVDQAKDELSKWAAEMRQKAAQLDSQFANSRSGDWLEERAAWLEDHVDEFLKGIIQFRPEPPDPLAMLLGLFR